MPCDASLKLLRQQSDQLNAECRQLRGEILRKLEAGAAVERGRYTARVQQSYRRTFSRKAIEGVYGRHYAEQIAPLLPETERTTLSVTERQGDHSGQHVDEPIA